MCEDYKPQEDYKPLTEEEIQIMENKSPEEEEATYWDNMEAMGY